MEVRTRVAPSPTGDPHVGTAYIALFNMVFAKKHKGKFILRIENTDRVRSTDKSEQMIMESLHWLGIRWDEGPDIGGDYGPYRQSERFDLYNKYAQELIDKGHAFRCFCDENRLDKLRETQQANKETTHYDGLCMHLSSADVEKKLMNNESYVVRMKVPTEGVCIVHDMFRGDVEIPWDRVDMQVLLKSDGWPTYFLANVVDDYLMRITHVLRGEEWLSSAPKIIKLYEYFGWNLPSLGYMPLLRNTDKSKLSKRKNPTSILFYKNMGFLPEALLNYLGRMGWSMSDEREKFSLQEMVEDFDLQRISLGGPIFDIDKLKWLNGQWIRSLRHEEFRDRLINFLCKEKHITNILPLVQERVQTFTQVAPLIGFLLQGDLEINSDLLHTKALDNLQSRKAMQLMLWKLESLQVWDKDEILSCVKNVAEILSVRLKDVMPLLFVSITSKTSSISVLDAMEVLGADISRYRIRAALELLGSPSKKEYKEWGKILL